MDLRDVLNSSDNGGRDRAPPAPNGPPTPQQKHQQHPPTQPPPLSTHHSQSPVAQYNYRDYPHPSPHAQHPQLPHQQQQQSQHAGSYLPPSPYQAPSPYLGRQHPPASMQTGAAFHDVRSPSAGTVPLGSAYRPSTTPSAASTANAGYPFPPTQSHPQQEMASPSQRHQYPPQPYQQTQQPPQRRRDSLSQSVSSAQAPVAYPHQQQPQQQQPVPQQHGGVPQTPPVGTPGGSYSYIHQRSQSTHSTPTPTSAQSQHQYGPPHVQGSPGGPAPPLAQGAEYGRHPSQPQTPLGPPLSAGPRPPHAAGSFAQPPSPYQQRMSSAHGATAVQQRPLSQASPRPTPPPPATTHRVPSSEIYDSPVSDSHQRPLSHHTREHSMSVSPKTRVPSLPNTSDRGRTVSAAGTEPEQKSAPAVHPMDIDRERAVTPAKRKMEDRDMSPQEVQRKEPRYPQSKPSAEVNGSNQKPADQPEPAAAPSKVRTRYLQLPTWAQSIHTLGSKAPKHANFVLQKRLASHINGRKETDGKPDRSSRHGTPEVTKSQSIPQGGQTAPAVEPNPQDILGPWEASITGVKPYEEVSKAVADFLFINVLNNEDYNDITSRGIAFEIEAKLGKLIDKDSFFRIDHRLNSEVVLQDTGRTSFKSSMTDVQHKSFNDFLNQVVIETDPRNPAGSGRVQIHYKHRREIDRFFDLTPDMLGRVPACMRARLGSRAKNIRVRVTYDQKTKEVLGKIVKARVADLDIHLPTCPMDCRISINLEMDWDGPAEELEEMAGSGQSDRQPDRSKDRLSYQQGHYQIDLTQVSQTFSGAGNAQRVDKEHELEIELSPTAVLEQGRRAMTGAPHRYQELVEGFVDNIRVLARKAKDFPRPPS